MSTTEPSRNHRPGRSPQPGAAQKPAGRIVALLVAGTVWAAVIFVLSTDPFSSQSRALRLAFCFLRAHLSPYPLLAPGLALEFRGAWLIAANSGLDEFHHIAPCSAGRSFSDC